MPGASEQTSQVKVLNVNWAAGADGEDGRFDVMIVTGDGEKHTFAPSPASLTALPRACTEGSACGLVIVLLGWAADKGQAEELAQFLGDVGAPGARVQACQRCELGGVPVRPPALI